MERIQAAIQKAKERRTGAASGASGGAAASAAASPQPPAPNRRGGSYRPVAGAVGPAWAELQPFAPDPATMARNRIVTFADTDPTHASFDMMRTKILRAMRQNGWTTLGITSPTAGCGKTTTVINLAFSIAHQPDVRTVLIDLDLRRPAIAKDIGLSVPQSMAGVLQGTRSIPESFVRYGDNLAIGTNAQPIKNSAELLLGASTPQGVAALKAAFLPDVMLFDLPPMLQSDDVMAFLPNLDCVLLVAGAERTRLDEVDKCEHDLAEQIPVLGVVLSMCRYTGEEYGYY
jgi:protein-tyrosine kinase